MIGLMLFAGASARGALVLVSGPGQSQIGNLVTNGSFEIGHPAGTGFSNYRYWATGTTLTPFALPPGWTSSGQPATYAVWGSDDTGPSYEIRFSDTFSHGQLGMYFGNNFAIPNQPPTFNPDGSVTFPSPPSFFVHSGGPAVLTQTVNTQLSPAPSYTLTFWVSGEESGSGGNPSTDEGIFGFRMTNVLAGDPMQFLAVPAGTGPQGASRFYRYNFVPLNSTLPVTIEFTNWGHMDLSAFGGVNFTTELVLDDVVIHANLSGVGAVPEPSSLALLALAAIAGVIMWRRR